MKNQGVSNKSFETLRIELEQKKKMKQSMTRQKKEEIKERKRQIKIQKRKKNIEEDKGSSAIFSG